MNSKPRVYKASRWPIVVVGVSVVVIALAALGFALATKGHGSLASGVGNGARHIASTTTTIPGRVSTSQATSTTTGSSGSSPSGSSTTTPLGTSTTLTQSSGNLPHVISITPAQGTKSVSPTGLITLTFSSPLASTSPTPILTPMTAGNWQISGNRAVFTPSEPFIPLSNVTVTLPKGAGQMRSSSGIGVDPTFQTSFTITNGSTLSLQEDLSLLAYSPLAWHSSQTSIQPSDTAALIAAFYKPLAGQFSWLQTGWPTELTSVWAPGSYNVFTKGLVMEFQADHGLIVNGDESAGLWNDLLQAISTGQLNSGGYNYALVNKAAPEYIAIWHNGHVVIKTPANTGIAVDPTTDGTFTVFAKYRNQVMHGTNPDGQTYADPVQYVSYFDGNQAVHYMPRPDYGIPQSLGCVELPLVPAAKVWPWLAYGTLITVIN